MSDKSRTLEPRTLMLGALGLVIVWLVTTTFWRRWQRRSNHGLRPHAQAGSTS